MEIKDQQKGVTQTIVIPFDLRQKVVDMAKHEGLSISSIICDAIKNKLKEEETSTVGE